MEINDSLNSLVYRTSIALKSRLQAALKDFDLTSEQWVTLTRLDNKGGRNQKELSKDSFREPAAMTRILDILEKKGLVERRKSANDRREFLVFMTDKGKDVLAKTGPGTKRYRDLLASLLTEEERETLTSLLKKLSNGLTSTR